MAASPEFFKPSSALSFHSPCGWPRVLGGMNLGHSFRTPNDAKTSCSLREPGTCPPAPRKPPAPPACKKRLFEAAEVLSFRLDELERIFRPCVQQSHSRQRRSPDESRRASDDC